MSEDGLANGGGIARVLKVVYFMADQQGGEVGVTQAARALEMPKAAVFRVLRGLVDNGFASYDENSRRYSLGPGALTVGLAALRDMDVPRAARPVMESMVERTAETATLSAFRGTHRIYIDQVVSPKQIRFTVEIGATQPLYAGSSSKCILAALPAGKAEALLDDIGTLRPLTSGTVVNRAQLEEEMERIRTRGYAVSFGERDGDAASVASAILQPGGHVFGALSLCGPLNRFDRRLVPEYGQLVKTSAEEISAAIGYRVATPSP